MFKYLDKKFKIRRRAIATFASMHFFGNPSSKMKIIGITGTNGKTTIATLLYKLFTKLGYKCGLLSTVQNIIIEEIRVATHTTPSPILLNKLLNEMADKGCEYVFMEVSSHAMDQERVAGIKFTGGIFTNLTHDHLDYHKNIENYFNAKKKFFKQLLKNAFALSNIDDEYGLKMLNGIKAKKYTYGFKNDADYKERLQTKLIGEFNAYNTLAVYATAILLGEDVHEVKEILKDLDGADGRFEIIISDGITGIVDFAHTPSGLENVLETISNLNKKKGRIISIFGCGGDRDKSKRKEMMKTVYEFSDIIISTADNLRSEEIQDIFRDMKKGLPEKINKQVLFIEDRREAIKKACEIAEPRDYILLAGKGHEKYQEIKGVKYPFSDMEELKKFLK